MFCVCKIYNKDALQAIQRRVIPRPWSQVLAFIVSHPPFCPCGNPTEATETDSTANVTMGPEVAELCQDCSTWQWKISQWMRQGTHTQISFLPVSLPTKQFTGQGERGRGREREWVLCVWHVCYLQHEPGSRVHPSTPWLPEFVQAVWSGPAVYLAESFAWRATSPPSITCFVPVYQHHRRKMNLVILLHRCHPCFAMAMVAQRE